MGTSYQVQTTDQTSVEYSGIQRCTYLMCSPTTRGRCTRSFWVDITNQPNVGEILKAGEAVHCLTPAIDASLT
jgi:hypothetical protein